MSAPAPPDRHTPGSLQNRAIGLSARHRAEEATSPRSKSLKQQRAERAAARYPFGQGTFWLSVLVFASFVLACLYWITYIASTQP